MLIAVSLAEKLGNRGLLAFSLHPGVIGTNLGNHLDWNADLVTLRESSSKAFAGGTSTNEVTGAADRALGNAEGWSEFKYKTLDQGIATMLYAAFEPSLSGMHAGHPVPPTYYPSRLT
jgi:NAD(P)-dependent dehydrogenase (short-subunit alcohol dehydrogenase family)